ncbi:MAG: phosphatase PAP2 family protein [Oscillospiraceae bacterium]|nr:phosphatase PAP2 family protein [Oscillospiraceae bacterium]
MTMTAGAYWLNSTFSAFDEGITMAVHRLYEACGGWMTPIMELISLLGKGGIFLILLSVILMLCRPTRRFGTAMALGLAIGAIAVNLWLKVVIARPRPYADVNGVFYPLWQMLGSHTESDFSFPSGHTNAAFASMVPVFLLGDKKWSWLALLFAFLMGVSRIYLVVHFPSDVLGGIITGTIAGLIGTLIAKLIPTHSVWYGWDVFKKRTKGAHE